MPMPQDVAQLAGWGGFPSVTPQSSEPYWTALSSGKPLAPLSALAMSPREDRWSGLVAQWERLHASHPSH